VLEEIGEAIDKVTGPLTESGVGVEESVTVIVRLTEADAAGVPEIDSVAGISDKPVGNVPDVKLHV